MQAEFLAIDTETTGLDPSKNQVVDIALVLLDNEFNVLSELQVFAHPDATAVIEAKAVEINGYTAQAWTAKNAVTQAEMFDAVYDYVSEHTKLKLIAHNVSFDKSFLKALFTTHSVSTHKDFNSIFDYHALDTISLALFLDYVQTGQARKRYSLSSLTADYQIKHAEAHTAKSDIHACIDLLRVLKDAVKGTLSIAPPLNGYKTTASRYSRIIKKEEDGWRYTYGKYEGRLVLDVHNERTTYVKFVLGFSDLSPEQRTYLESLPL